MASGEPLDLAALRQEYRLASLSEGDAPAEPMALFRRWMADAADALLTEPNAMVVATADADGRPAARMVLLKGSDDSGFRFFTNYGSRKATHLGATPFAALLFPWVDIQRQVEVAGPVERLGDDESDAYFASRPRESQLGAWASRQSSVVSGRDVLEDEVRALAARYEGREVPRPPFWGGFRVIPLRMEFWQGRAGRLHDRLRYQRASATEPWVRERLAP